MTTVATVTLMIDRSPTTIENTRPRISIASLVTSVGGVSVGGRTVGGDSVGLVGVGDEGVLDSSVPNRTETVEEMSRINSSFDTFKPGKSFGTEYVFHQWNVELFTLLACDFSRQFRTRFRPIRL